MNFEPTERQVYWRDRVRNFIDAHVRPRTAVFYKQSAEGVRWQVIPGGVEHEGWFPTDCEVIHIFPSRRDDFLSADAAAYMRKS